MNEFKADLFTCILPSCEIAANLYLALIRCLTVSFSVTGTSYVTAVNLDLAL